MRLARAVERKDDGVEDTQTPLELCRLVLCFCVFDTVTADRTLPVDQPMKAKCKVSPTQERENVGVRRVPCVEGGGVGGRRQDTWVVVFYFRL